MLTMDEEQAALAARSGPARALVGDALRAPGEKAAGKAAREKAARRRPPGKRKRPPRKSRQGKAWADLAGVISDAATKLRAAPRESIWTRTDGQEVGARGGGAGQGAAAVQRADDTDSVE